MYINICANIWHPNIYFFVCRLERLIFSRFNEISPISWIRWIKPSRNALHGVNSYILSLVSRYFKKNSSVKGYLIINDFHGCAKFHRHLHRPIRAITCIKKNQFHIKWKIRTLSINWYKEITNLLILIFILSTQK